MRKYLILLHIWDLFFADSAHCVRQECELEDINCSKSRNNILEIVSTVKAYRKMLMPEWAISIVVDALSKNSAFFAFIFGRPILMREGPLLISPSGRFVVCAVIYRRLVTG